MNNRILTPHEREVIKLYLDGGERVSAIRVYLSRAKRSQKTLIDDLELIDLLIQHG
jgi:capsular polysaccharide biosynthesis protein